MTYSKATETAHVFIAWNILGGLNSLFGVQDVINKNITCCIFGSYFELARKLLL